MSKLLVAPDLVQAKQHVLQDWFEDSDESLLPKHNIDVVPYDDKWQKEYKQYLELVRAAIDPEETANDDSWS